MEIRGIKIDFSFNSLDKLKETLKKENITEEEFKYYVLNDSSILVSDAFRNNFMKRLFNTI